MNFKEHASERYGNNSAATKAVMVPVLNLETIQVDNVISMMAKVPSVNVQMARKLHRLIFLHLSSINGTQPSPLTMWCYIIYSDPSYLKTHINGFGDKSAKALRDIKIHYRDHYEILEKGTALRMIQKCTHAIDDDLAYLLDPEVRGSLSGHEMRQIEAAFRSGMSLIASAIYRAVMNKPVYLTKRPVGFEPPQTREEYTKLFKPGGAVKGMHAIVEYENGAIECVHPSSVRFVDNECTNIWAERDYVKSLQNEDLIKMLTGPVLREDQILK